MNKDEIKNKLENLEVPEIGSTLHKNKLRLTLLNMQRSHKIGYALIIIPVLFLLGVLLKYIFHFNIPVFNPLESLMAEWDKITFLKPVFPVLYLLLPLVALLMNLLASFHFSWNSQSRELNILYRFRWSNFIIIIFSLLILLIFFLYLVTENY